MPYGTVNADVISTSVANTSLGAGNATRFKNRIINGDMRIDQRNAGASVTPTSGTYSVDRFKVFCSQSSKLSFQQNAGSVTPTTGFTNYLGITSLSAYSVTSTDEFGIYQAIEGYNMADFAWGTASAKTITISFWVRSSLTGTFGGSLRNSAADRSYAYTYTISVANTWEQKSVTIAGDTSGTWLTTNGAGIYLSFNLGAGSTLVTTANAWAAGNYLAPTGATSVVGTNGATFYITGVQLEVGSSATGFEYVDYGTQLAMCQRYFVGMNMYNNAFLGQGTTTIVAGITVPVYMRAQPSVANTGSGSDSGSAGSNGTGYSINYNSIALPNSWWGGTQMWATLTVTGGSPPNQYAGLCRVTNFQASAEL
jgi:hypothetical protein